jgi:hypothetical protein
MLTAVAGAGCATTGTALFTSQSHEIRQRNQNYPGKQQEVKIRYHIGHDKKRDTHYQRNYRLLLAPVNKEPESNGPEYHAPEQYRSIVH